MGTRGLAVIGDQPLRHLERACRGEVVLAGAMSRRLATPAAMIIMIGEDRSPQVRLERARA